MSSSSPERAPPIVRDVPDGWAKIAVTLLAVFHLACLGYSAVANSPVSDEPAHLVAGIHIWRTGNHSLYCVNPPLVKQLAAIPAMLVGYRGPAELYDGYSNSLRTEWARGAAFIRENGRDGVRLITLGRLLTMLCSLVGYWTVVRWSYDLYGNSSAIFAGALWCISPTILGHSPLITADGAAMVLGVLAWYCFREFLVCPGPKQVFVLAIVTSLAILAKFTSIFFIPMFFVVVGLTIFFPARASLNEGTAKVALAGRWVPLQRLLGVTVLIYLFVHIGFGFDDFGRTLREFDFHSHALGGHNLLEQSSGNRFRGEWYARIPLPISADIVRGLDQQRRDFELYAASYLNGEYRSQGWWYYYLYAACIKEPLSALVLMVLRSALAVLNPRQWGLNREEWFLLFPAATFGVIVSSQTGMNHHYRYFMPLLPMVVVFLSGFVKSGGWMAWVRQWVGGALLTSAAISVFLQYPYTIGYFNELVGGPKNGWRHLNDSNTDWGQGVWALESWLRQHSDRENVVVAPWTLACDPRRLGVSVLPKNPNSIEDLFPALVDADSFVLRPGLYVFSENVLCRPQYRAFQEYEIEETIGGAYVVMRLSADDVTQLNKQRKEWHLSRGIHYGEAAKPESGHDSH